MDDSCLLLKMNEYISNYYIRIKIEDIFKQDKSNNLIGNTAEEKYDYYMQYFFYNKRHMQLLVKQGFVYTFACKNLYLTICGRAAKSK